MSINYVIKKRIFGFDEMKNEKFIVTPVNSGTVDFKKLCAQVCQICGAHRGVVQLVTAGVIDAMINNLEDGKSVRLGEFGIFRPSIRTRAADKVEDADASCVYRKHIIFTPGAAFKEAMRDTSVTRFNIPSTGMNESETDAAL